MVVGWVEVRWGGVGWGWVATVVPAIKRWRRGGVLRYGGGVGRVGGGGGGGDRAVAAWVGWGWVGCGFGVVVSRARWGWVLRDGGQILSKLLRHFIRPNGPIVNVCTHVFLRLLYSRNITNIKVGGIHVWHMPVLTEIFGDDSVLQFGGRTLGHPWGNAPGAVANRVALEACVQARNEGCDLATEGNEIIREATKWSPELATACEVWKEIKFEFQAMDTLDTDKDKDKKR
ncbi:hypothetical protein L1987_63351 [Smallanthus sonchifolius]|uniref:Uncharacterized protein n=1 Tax=Smallanthus sonchifolius TaxID=185202 RepID=A0ACB9CCW3_9ASTR|nr:hypothetical protein L1987_63351 [Smallanthus sonchifolius]